MPLLRFIESEVDAIDELVLIVKESDNDMLRRIGHARKRVMSLLRLLITKADVLKAVIKRCAERLAPDSETTLYLGDIQDHVITMLQNLSHCEKTLARAHSNYLAQISIEITQASNRTSDVVMRMTALGGILIPLNVITGELIVSQSRKLSSFFAPLLPSFIQCIKTKNKKGLWGMNVRVPGQDGDNLHWFAGIVTVMAIIVASAVMIVRTYKTV